ncbi:MAG: hypothetical protein AAFR74_09230 [Pseudomonadota bacterium]
MSHTYPIAISAKAALKSDGPCAATRYEAEAVAGEEEITALETEWLTPSEAERAALLKNIYEHPAKGFVQTYEDAQGETVFAVTYWKIGPPKRKKPKAKQRAKAKAKDATPISKPRTRKRYIDPNQLDLFKD